MKVIKLKKLKIRNFLSIGNDPIEIDFISGLNIITGINKDKEDSKNGVGKCLSPDTIVNVNITDPVIYETFIKFLNKKRFP